MSTQQPLVINYTNDEAWSPQVSSLLKAETKGNKMWFDNEIGKGEVCKIEIDWGLSVRRMKLVFNEPVIFARNSIASSEKGYYVLISNLSEQAVNTTTNDHHFKLGYTSDEGIYFSSPLLSASFTFTPGKQYHLIYIIITHERFKDFIQRQPKKQHDLLQSIIDSEKPLYHVEYVDTFLLQILIDIDNQINDDRPNNLLLHSRVLELCYQMLERVQKRNNITTAKIHADDVTSLNKVRKELSENYQLPCPPLETTAKKIGMSATKFKKLFKQMFGDSYYQYYKQVRMHKAKQLLEQGDMNVSEVGYLLGYSNLSKFSQAFKSMFRISPGSIAKK